MSPLVARALIRLPLIVPSFATQRGYYRAEEPSFKSPRRFDVKTVALVRLHDAGGDHQSTNE
jgi:hypothetical protein